MKSRNSRDMLRHGRELLKERGGSEYRTDALVLLSFVTGRPKEWLFTHEYELSEAETEKYSNCIKKRAEGIPTQYITGFKEFMGINFLVNEHTLIPRADTEILAERLIEASRLLEEPHLLDLCTGSGCIAVSAAYYNKNANIAAVDVSREAIALAEKNARLAGVLERVSFYTGDLFEPLASELGAFDIVASNPPYISKMEMASLPAEVKREPHIALYGGERGLDFYERISAEAYRYLKKNGLLIFETGCNQAESVVEIMNKNGYNNINIYRDLAGLNRVVEGVLQ